jgi:hypothetical protein
VTNVNVTNINIRNINVTNVNYVNRNVPGAITATSHEAFTSARPIGRAAVVVPTNTVAKARITGMTAPVAPRAESVAGHPIVAAQSVAKPPVAVIKRAVVSRVTPPPPPVPFAARQKTLAANGGKPLDSETVVKLRKNTANPLVKSATTPNSTSGPPKALKPAREGIAAPRPVGPPKGDAGSKAKGTVKEAGKGKKQERKPKEEVKPPESN